MSESTVSMGQSARAREDAASLEARLFSPRPTGAAVAALLAGAIGVFVLGLNTFLSAAGEGVAEWFRFQNRAGPLSGKTTMAGVGWLAIWAGFAAALLPRDACIYRSTRCDAAPQLAGVGYLTYNRGQMVSQRAERRET